MPVCFRFLFSMVLSSALATSATAAEPSTYALDPVHTRVAFLVEHAGFSRAIGAISGSSGTLRFDPDDWRTASLEVTVPLTRLDLGDAKWNEAVLAANLLDGKRHPEARFVSRQVEPGEPGHARVCGDLTLRGVTAPLCMDVTLNALRRHPFPPFRRTAGFSATATLSRKAYGITAWPTVIGDEVQLLIEAEAVRRRGAADDTEEAEDAGQPAPRDPAEAEPDPPPSTSDTPSPPGDSA